MNGLSSRIESPRRGDRFACTPAGVIAASRRRFSAFLMALASLMTVATLATIAAGRYVPALMAAAVGIVVGVAWKMSRELSPQWLEIADGELTIQTPRARLTIELERARVRLLEDGEIAHLRKLASTAGLVAGVGGFDSHLLGEFDLYASNLDKAVLIESSEDRIVVTPDQPAAFLVASAKAGAKV